MLSINEMFELTTEESVSDFDGFIKCDQCGKDIIGVFIVYDNDENSFCSYNCFDNWAVGEYSAQCDYIYEQYKETRRK